MAARKFTHSVGLERWMTSPAARPVGADRPVYAIAMMLAAVGLWALHDALAKNLACSAPGSLDTSLSHAAGLIEIAACHA